MITSWLEMVAEVLVLFLPEAGLGPDAGVGFCPWLSLSQLAESCLWEPKIWGPGIPGGIFGRAVELSSSSVRDHSHSLTDLQSTVSSLQLSRRSKPPSLRSLVSSFQFRAQPETTAIPSRISSLQFPVYSSFRDRGHFLLDL